MLLGQCMSPEKNILVLPSSIKGLPSYIAPLLAVPFRHPPLCSSTRALSSSRTLPAAADGSPATTDMIATAVEAASIHLSLSLRCYSFWAVKQMGRSGSFTPIVSSSSKATTLDLDPLFSPPTHELYPAQLSSVAAATGRLPHRRLRCLCSSFRSRQTGFLHRSLADRYFRSRPEMEGYSPLRELRPPGTNEAICVRVCRLWYHRGGTDRGPITDIHMVIADRQGEAAHAIVPQGFFQAFINSLHETRVYEFSRFRLIKKLEVLRPVDAEFAIVFTHLTTVGHRDDLIDVFPKRYYSLTPFSCLPSPAPDSGCLIDVLGAITAISDIKFFSIPNWRSPLLKRHVFLKDLSGHELKIVLWGNSALRFNGDTIRALGQTKPIIAIFVGTTVQAYDGSKGLAAGAPCSWYINEDIADINIFLTSPSYVFQPVAHASLPHVISLNSQVGENWPRKTIAQLSAFNLFENQESKFRCSVTISRMASSQQWWYTGCNRCHRMARASMPPYADPHTFTCSDHVCPCTDATLVYWFSVIASDRTGESEFTLFGSLAT